MSGAFRFETFIDTHSNIFNEYLSSVVVNLSKENEEYKAIPLWTKINRPTAGRTKAIHRRPELSFNLYLLLLLWVKTELPKASYI